MSAAYIPAPAADPAALPDPDRPGTTYRYLVDEHLVPVLKAVLRHPAETVVRRPDFAKDAS